MKKTLYPKTPRIKNSKTIITEKLDGSNLGIFKIYGELVIAQRDNVYPIRNLTRNLPLKLPIYKGLKGWLEEYGETLDLCEGNGVFGEWLGMGHISYEKLDKKFYIFAKANINEEWEVRNIVYQRDFFKYPFQSKNIPDCMGVVPLVKETTDSVGIGSLGELYEHYTDIQGRAVEGFIIMQGNTIQKYLRYKNGKFSEHKA